MLVMEDPFDALRCAAEPIDAAAPCQDHSTPVCHDLLAMARKYQLKKRAERQEETRRRIVEATVDLHQTVGPARSSVSAIAERAGVQRHTYYRHFPDERSLYLACSG